MTILDIFQTRPKPKTIITSRPIFQHASSWLDDDEDDDLKKPPLPLFHQQEKLTKAQPKPQARLNLILHILNILFTSTSIILFASAIPTWDANFEHTKSLIKGDYTDGLVLAPLILSLGSSTYLLLTQHSPLKTQTSPTIRPKSLILMSLTILLTLMPALTLSATNSLALAWRSPQRTKAGVIVCNLANVFTPQCQPTLYKIGGLQIGGITAGSLAWCVWTVVLVIIMRLAVRERRERERLAKERRRVRRAERKMRHERRRRDKGQEAGISGLDKTVLRHGSVRDNSSEIRQVGFHAFGPSYPHTNNSRTYGAKSVGLSQGPRPESPAAQLASNTVRPKETIQQWLNSRHA